MIPRYTRRELAEVWSDDVGAVIPSPREPSYGAPLSGLAQANGVLVVPAGSKLVAYAP